MAEKLTAKSGKKAINSLAKSAVKNFCEASTIHGISSIYSASTATARVFWIGTFLIVSSLLIWQVSVLVVEVNRKDVLLATKKVSRDQLEFPSVIVSNAGPYSKSKLRKITPVANGSLHVEHLKKTISNLTFNKVNEVGNHLEYSCLFGGNKCQAEKIPFPLIGTYLQFNRKMYWKQTNPGPENGLELVLHINESDYSNTFKLGYGVVIDIGDPFVTYTHLHNKGIAAAPGTLTKINMQVTKIKRLPYPYPDNCESTTDVKELQGFHFRVTLYGMYSLDFCKFLAMVRNQMKSCGVVDPEYKFLVDDLVIIEKSNVSYTITGTSEEIENMKNCLKRVKNGKIKSNCRCPCISQKYDFTISHLRWPPIEEAEERLEEWKKSKPQANNGGNWSLDDIYKNLLKVQIYFSEFDVDEIEQRPARSLVGFASDLGGLIGLYIGASVYSGIEIFSLLISLIYYLCQKTSNGASMKSKEIETSSKGTDQSSFLL